MFARAIQSLERAQRRLRDYAATFPAAWRVRLAVESKLRGVNLSFDPSTKTASVSRDNRVVRVSSEFPAYVWDVLTNFEGFFAMVEPKREGELLVVDYSQPQEHVLRTSGIPFYFTTYAENDETSELYLELAGLRPGGVVFDGGAYCGASSYSFSKAVGPTGKVLAFEPDTRNHGALLKNIERHHLSNVIPVKKGLWSSTTTLSFLTHGNMGSRIVEGAPPDPNVHQIEVTSLADAFTANRLERLDFLKLDIEGAEVAVIAAAKDFLRARRPRIVIEAHYVNGVLTTNDLREALRSAGFRSQILLEAIGSPFHLVYAWPDGEPARPTTWS
jgi:FkbM family methyltransferase